MCNKEFLSEVLFLPKGILFFLNSCSKLLKYSFIYIIYFDLMFFDMSYLFCIPFCLIREFYFPPFILSHNRFFKFLLLNFYNVLQAEKVSFSHYEPIKCR